MMRALRVTTWHEEPELLEVPEPEPRPGQVVIKVGGAGACHSDLHMTHGAAAEAPWPLPFTLGHENAGWVHATGEGVTGVTPGEPVAVYGAWGCGTCSRCRDGLENYCESTVQGAGSGLGLDGGMAEYMLVPDVRYLIPLPDGLSPQSAAPLTDAALTTFHAVHRSATKLLPRSAAVVIGVGGLGHMAVQILKATTAAHVVAVDTRAEALELALSCGADTGLLAGEEVASAVKTLTGGRGADLVLDCVGTGATIATAVRCVRTLGDLTLIGVAGGAVPFGFLQVPVGASLQSVYWGTRSELAEVLSLGARGLITAHATTYRLEDAVAAYRDLAAGALLGRAVVVPHQDG